MDRERQSRYLREKGGSKFWKRPELEKPPISDKPQLSGEKKKYEEEYREELVDLERLSLREIIERYKDKVKVLKLQLLYKGYTGELTLERGIISSISLADYKDDDALLFLAKLTKEDITDYLPMYLKNQLEMKGKMAELRSYLEESPAKEEPEEELEEETVEDLEALMEKMLKDYMGEEEEDEIRLDEESEEEEDEEYIEIEEEEASEELETSESTEEASELEMELQDLFKEIGEIDESSGELEETSTEPQAHEELIMEDVEPEELLPETNEDLSFHAIGEIELKDDVESLELQDTLESQSEEPTVEEREDISQLEAELEQELEELEPEVITEIQEERSEVSEATEELELVLEEQGKAEPSEEMPIQEEPEVELEPSLSEELLTVEPELSPSEDNVEITEHERELEEVSELLDVESSSIPEQKQSTTALEEPEGLEEGGELRIESVEEPLHEAIRPSIQVSDIPSSVMSESITTEGVVSEMSVAVREKLSSLIDTLLKILPDPRFSITFNRDTAEIYSVSGIDDEMMADFTVATLVELFKNLSEIGRFTGIGEEFSQVVIEREDLYVLLFYVDEVGVAFAFSKRASLPVILNLVNKYKYKILKGA